MGGDVSKFSAPQMTELLTHVRDNIGISDIYNSDRAYVKGKMSPIGHAGQDAVGMFQKNADVHKGVFVEGKFTFQGSSHAAGGVQNFENGALIIKTESGARAIDAAEAAKTWTKADGSAVHPSSSKSPMAKTTKSGARFGALGFMGTVVGGSIAAGTALLAGADWEGVKEAARKGAVSGTPYVRSADAAREGRPREAAQRLTEDGLNTVVPGLGTAYGEVVRPITNLVGIATGKGPLVDNSAGTEAVKAGGNLAGRAVHAVKEAIEPTKAPPPAPNKGSAPAP